MNNSIDGSIGGAGASGGIVTTRQHGSSSRLCPVDDSPAEQPDNNQLEKAPRQVMALVFRTHNRFGRSCGFG